MKMAKSLVLLLCVVILPGCATVQMTAKDAPLVEKKELNFLHTPVESLGIKVTKNLLEGRTRTVAATFPERGFAEEYPGRISWKCWSANLETEREFFSQLARAGILKDGSFVGYFMIDDDSIEAMESHGVFLSSNLSFVADLGGNVFPLDAANWRGSKAYRLEIIRRYGSPLKNLNKVKGFEETVKKWNRYELKGVGEIFSPYGDEDLKKIAAINPAYNLLEKIALKGNLTVYLDPVATASNLALNIIIASNVKSEAFDYTSNIPNRETMGVIIEYVNKYRLELIRKLNQTLLTRRE